MKAMILAAGLGSRLGIITESIPKALVEINGKSALQLAVEKCTSHGFNDIIVNVHHFAAMVEEEVERLNNSGFRITVSDERKCLLETGGGLFKAKDFFDNHPFLLYNVDVISDIDLSELYRYHLEKRGIATLAVRKISADRCFLVDDTFILRGWKNIVTGEQILTVNSPSGLSEAAFMGIHVIDPEIFQYMNDGVYSMTNLYLALAKDHKIFTFWNDSGFWIDLGSPENLKLARKISGKL